MAARLRPAIGCATKSSVNVSGLHIWSQYVIFRVSTIIDCFWSNWPYTSLTGFPVSGGDLDSTWVAKLRVHAEGQITSLIQL